MNIPLPFIGVARRGLIEPLLESYARADRDMAFMAYVERRIRKMPPTKAAVVKLQMIKDRARHEARLAGYSRKLAPWYSYYLRVHIWRKAFIVLFAISLFAGVCRWADWYEHIYKPAQPPEWGSGR